MNILYNNIIIGRKLLVRCEFEFMVCPESSLMIKYTAMITLMPHTIHVDTSEPWQLLFSPLTN